jgi:Tol biopolymer transport system component
MVFDGKHGLCFDAVMGPVFSPDGKHLAYNAKEGGKWFVVRDGVPGPKWDMVYTSGPLNYWLGPDRFPSHDPTYSPDGQHITYVGFRGDTQFPVLDTTSGPGCDEVIAMTFSPDGKRLAYVEGRNHTWSVVVDGVSGPGFYLIPQFTFSPDSRHYAYVGAAYGLRSTPKHVVFDGRPEPEAVGIGILKFSPSGNRLAYSITTYPKGNAESRMVVDGRLGPEFDRVWEPSFGADESVEYLAVKDTTLYRVRHLP